MMEPGEFDLVGFAVGVVERDRRAAAATCGAGDRVVGFASPGLRCNGYSLARAALLDRDGRAPRRSRVGRRAPHLAEELLRPSVIYAPAMLRLAREVDVHAFAHVTGGGIPGNLERVLPERLRRRHRARRSGTSRASSREIQRAGDVGDDEMEHVFNLGLGMLAVVAADDALARGRRGPGRGTRRLARRRDRRRPGPRPDDAPRTVSAPRSVRARAVALGLPRCRSRDAVRRLGGEVRRRVVPRRRRRPPRRPRPSRSRRDSVPAPRPRRSARCSRRTRRNCPGWPRAVSTTASCGRTTTPATARASSRSIGAARCETTVDLDVADGDRLGRHRRSDGNDALRRRHRRQPAAPAPRSTSTASPSRR